MNIPGVYFNNRNWPYIVRAVQLWAMIGLVAAPAVYFVMNTLLESIWNTAGVYFVLLFTLGGLFIPMCYAGRKYEFAPGHPRPATKNRKDWIWIGTTIVLIAVLTIVIRTSGGFSTGSGLRVMWSEEKTAESWCATYAYHDGYQQRTVNLNDEPTTMDVEIVTTDGTIGIIVTADDGNILFNQESIQTTSFSIDLPGKVLVRINSDAHKGSYAIHW